jgi:hypothetical protein
MNLATSSYALASSLDPVGEAGRDLAHPVGSIFTPASSIEARRR